MHFNNHLNLEGQHAFLSASKYHWINYDETKLVETYSKFQAAQHGTELHEFAKRCIELGIKLPKNKQTLNLYVNDAIGYRMTPEQILYFSPNAFGTADAISFRKNLLRIHDLKTGVTPVSMHQVEVYAALFCLEYQKKPSSIGMELRIYQTGQALIHEPQPEDIEAIMEKIVIFDKRIEELKSEE
ncbi:MAG: protein of unknown function DUF2800 [Chaetfec virus UA24_144]|nr:MAG: protein of unknown function DUF2800 [Chaetfec virus UA24_144]